MLAQMFYSSRDTASVEAALLRAERVAQGPDEKRLVSAVRQQMRPLP